MWNLKIAKSLIIFFTDGNKMALTPYGKGYMSAP